jgi:predicted dehydrogenase
MVTGVQISCAILPTRREPGSSLLAISTPKDWLCRRRYPDVTVTAEFRDLIDNGVDVIAVATPVHTQYELALAALRAGKHVLIAQTTE